MNTEPGSLAGVETPALLLDVDVMEANLASMAAYLGERGIRLRPHTKTHKSVEIARRQLAHGAAGITVATIGEAETFAAAGFTDIFIAYPVFASGTKAARIGELARRVKLRVGVESLAGAGALARALGGGAGTAAPAEVLIEIDSGQHRTGVPPGAAGDLAVACRSLGLDVAGVFTHGGHGYAPSAGTAAAADEDTAVHHAAQQLTAAGFDVREVSAGSTPTVSFAGRHVTEERPGVYVFYDRQQLTLGSCQAGQVAVAVAATVVSTTVSGQAVIDAGSKALTTDSPPWLTGHGSVPELDGAVVVSLSEHHGLIDLGGGPAPAVGTVVTVMPNHICTVVNLFDRYTLVRSGRLAGTWAIDARGHLS